jgi:hypothetical protein
MTDYLHTVHQPQVFAILLAFPMIHCLQSCLSDHRKQLFPLVIAHAYVFVIVCVLMPSHTINYV